MTPDEAMRALLARMEAIERKLDRLFKQVEFIRTHEASYLGDGIALTHLADDTPIFVNSNDFGSPMNFVEGGRYEEGNLAVLQSLVTGRTRFVDVGANLGYFSLLIGQRVRKGGSVLAFEPHPRVFDLLSRSIFLNGLPGTVTAHNFGLSDRDAAAELRYPIGHLGGGHVGRGGSEGSYTVVQSHLRPFDTLVPADYTCDLVKIDVEGHELEVLRGMRATLARSPSVAVLFENLEAGHEPELRSLLDSLGFSLFHVTNEAQLVPLTAASGQNDWHGYVLAARAATIEGRLSRNWFRIDPQQFNLVGNVGSAQADGAVPLSGDGVLFHGPYWFLPKGTWRLTLEGSLSGSIRVEVAERYGSKIADLEMDGAMLTREFAVDHDLVRFELIVRARAPGSTLTLRRVELERLG